jgi:PKD repeat protein
VQGYSDSVIRTNAVTVAPPTIVAGFEQSTASVVAGLTVTFTDTSTTNGPPIVGWLWDFGDGVTSAGQNPTYAYDTPGVYTVTLVVTDALGYSGILGKANAVTVTPSCVELTGVTFVHAPQAPTIGSAVVFTATPAPAGATTPITYTWDFGDDGEMVTSSAVVSHTYAASGAYAVQVTAENPCAVRVYERQVIIEPFRVFLPFITR